MSQLPDQLQRHQALAPDQSFIVQAPAGSGKTTLLAQRYLHLLATVQQPEEILAITFTKKAAAEMKSRVMDLLRESTPIATSAVAHAQQRDWQIFRYPARLKIQTIDSFALELASRMPKENGISGSRIVEHAAGYYVQAAEQLLNRLYRNDPIAPYIAEFLSDLDNDAEQAIRLLSAMLARRDQWLEPVSAVALDQESRAASLTDALRRGVEQLHQQVTRRIEQRWTATDQQAVVHLADLNQCPSELGAVLPLLLKQDGELRRQLTKHQGATTPAVRAEFKQWLTSLHDRGLAPALEQLKKLPDAEITPEHLERVKRSAVCLSLAAVELERLFIEDGILDFTGLLIEAKRALRDRHGPTELAMYLDYQIRHLLVDEYQDTSRAQLELFNLLTEAWQRDGQTTFFCVGDPMQSIYRFRDADVSIFSQTKDQGLQNLPLQPLSLSSNFRSSHTLVDWTNQLFARVFGDSEGDLTGTIKHAAAVPMTGDTLPQNEPSCCRYSNETDEHNAIVERIESLLASDDSSSIALLCRARTHIEPLLQTLRQREIPWQATDIDLLAQEPVIGDLMSLYQVILSPSLRLPWFSLLRSPLFGMTLAELTHWAQATDLIQSLRQQAGEDLRLTRLWQVLDWASTHLYSLSLREVIEGSWFRFGAAAAYTSQELQQAAAWFELLDDLGTNAYQWSNLELALNQLFANRQNDARLQIMTIHKSKGLEFDHVIVPYLNRQTRSDDSPLIQWRPSTDGLLLGTKGDQIHGWLRYEEQQRARNEDKRLLYVACTRAAQSLWLSFTQQGARPGGLAKWLDPVAEDGVTTTVSSDQIQPAAAIQQSLFSEPYMRRLPKAYEWQPPRYEALHAPGVHYSVDAIGARREVALGNIVHRALAWYTASPTRAREISPQLEHLLHRWLRQEKLYDPAIVHDATTHLQRTLDDDVGRWLLADHAEQQSEIALSAMQDGALVNVVLDRTFIDDSIRWIVDYKTATPTDDLTLPDFLHQETQRYTPQLVRYGNIGRSIFDEPIKLALYFTGVSRFVEIGEV